MKNLFVSFFAIIFLSACSQKNNVVGHSSQREEITLNYFLQYSPEGETVNIHVVAENGDPYLSVDSIKIVVDYNLYADDVFVKFYSETSNKFSLQLKEKSAPVFVKGIIVQ
jgi:hypothetical protein